MSSGLPPVIADVLTGKLVMPEGFITECGPGIIALPFDTLVLDFRHGTGTGFLVVDKLHFHWSGRRVCSQDAAGSGVRAGDSLTIGLTPALGRVVMAVE